MATGKDSYSSVSTATCTLASLANAAGRVCTQLDLTSGTYGTAPKKVMFFVRFRTGSSAPTANTCVQFFWARGDEEGTPHVDSGLATTDTGYTSGSTPTASAHRDQLTLVYAQPVTTATATDYYCSFVVDNPSPRGSIYVYNDTGQTLDSTSGNFYVRYCTITSDIS